MATAEDQAKLALAQFLAVFVPFAKENGGANFAEMSAVLSTMGVSLTPEQIEAIGSQPPPGPRRTIPVQPWQPTKPDFISPPPAPNKAFSLEPNQGYAPRLAKEGVASQVFPAVHRLLDEAATKIPDVEALRVETPGLPVDKAGSSWVSYTWSQYQHEVRRFAKALLAIGFEPFEAVAVCGFNHPCWFFAHLGATAAGGMSAGTYTTSSAEACQFIATDSNSRVVAVDTPANLAKYVEVKAQLPHVKHAIIWGVDKVPAEIKDQVGDWALTYKEFVAKGDAVDDATYEARANAVEAKDCQTLIYTSGTTGTPKGVMISHDNVAFSSAAAMDCLGLPKDMHHHVLSFLPLSHIAAQALDVGIPLTMAARGQPVTVSCARPDALKGTLGASLVAVRPTYFFGVPRVWEKFVEGIKAKGAAAPGPQTVQQLKAFAARVGVAGSLAKQSGGNGELPYGYEICQKAVFAKVREALGLDRCEACLTGAAPTTRQTFDFMSAMGIDVYEVLGMSETSGMGSMSNARHFRFGACGFPMHPTELKLDHVASRDKPGEGEICFRGRSIMMGYLRNEAKTREVIDAEGWMHSGDIGRFDADGAVSVTGRIKELIITAGGENIAPVPIEALLKLKLPAISNAVMVGDKRKYNIVLLTLKTKPNLDTGAFYDELIAEAAAVNPNVTTVAAAVGDSVWRDYIQHGLDQVNATAVSNAAKIQKFAILPTDLSVPGGELTATLKTKRDVVAAKYQAVIDSLYKDE